MKMEAPMSRPFNVLRMVGCLVVVISICFKEVVLLLFDNHLLFFDMQRKY